MLELVVKLTSLKPVKLAIHTFDFWIALQVSVNCNSDCGVVAVLCPNLVIYNVGGSCLLQVLALPISVKCFACSSEGPSYV